ncbi:hypothetical protein N9B19_05165 [Akkermansiaceae bacterium]|nr:hypothetical protein [Akkermansiaceae bacterium]
MCDLSERVNAGIGPPGATQAALKKLLDSNLGQMGSAGRKHVENDYTIQREANSLVDFYQSILHKGSNN